MTCGEVPQDPAKHVLVEPHADPVAGHVVAGAAYRIELHVIDHCQLRGGHGIGGDHLSRYQ